VSLRLSVLGKPLKVWSGKCLHQHLSIPLKHLQSSTETLPASWPEFLKMQSSDMTSQQKKSNLRLGLVLASVAAVFFLGVVLKVTFVNN
jgi:hypothetical protein